MAFLSCTPSSASVVEILLCHLASLKASCRALKAAFQSKTLLFLFWLLEKVQICAAGASLQTVLRPCLLHQRQTEDIVTISCQIIELKCIKCSLQILPLYSRRLTLYLALMAWGLTSDLFADEKTSKHPKGLTSLWRELHHAKAKEMSTCLTCLHVAERLQSQTLAEAGECVQVPVHEPCSEGSSFLLLPLAMGSSATSDSFCCLLLRFAFGAAASTSLLSPEGGLSTWASSCVEAWLLIEAFLFAACLITTLQSEASQYSAFLVNVRWRSSRESHNLHSNHLVHVSYLKGLQAAQTSQREATWARSLEGICNSWKQSPEFLVPSS